MIKAEAIEEYLRLTDEIKHLSDQRSALKTYFHEGRNSGIGRDIRVSRTNPRRIDMWLLRKYVTVAIIDMCMISSMRTSVAVVPKPKPPKPKKGKT